MRSRLVLALSILAAIGSAGCVGGYQPKGPLWVETLPNGFVEQEVQFQMLDGSPDGQIIRLSFADLDRWHPLLNEAVTVFVAQIGDAPEIDTYWIDGVPVGLRSVPGSGEEVAVFSQARTRMSSVQQLYLPAILLSDPQGLTLPRGLPLSDWVSEVRNVTIGRPLTLEWIPEGATGPVWRLEYEMDEQSWPVRVQSEPLCVASPCDGPFIPGEWKRTNVGGYEPLPGLGQLGLAEFLAPEQAFHPALPLPALHPGGFALSLEDAIAQARQGEGRVADFMEDNARWFVNQADFKGSSETGETNWSVILGSGEDPRGIAFSVLAPRGTLVGTSPLVQVTYLGDSMAEVRLPSDDALVTPESSSLWLPSGECEGSPGGIVEMSFQLGSARDYRLGAGAVRTGTVGAAKGFAGTGDCEDLTIGALYGLMVPALLNVYSFPWEGPGGLVSLFG